MIRLHIIGLCASDVSKQTPRCGDAQIIDDGTNYEVIDGYCGKGANRLISALKKRKIYSPYLHITHAHYDHYYGIRAIIRDKAFAPKALYCYDPDSLRDVSKDVKDNKKALLNVINEAKARKIPVVYLKNGSIIEHGDINIVVYRNQPSKFSGNSDAYVNDGSLCYWFPGIAYLTTGDAGLDVAKQHGHKPKFIKLGHHGNNCVRVISRWLKDHGCKYCWDNDYSTSLTDFLMTGREDALAVGMTYFSVHGDINAIFRGGKAIIYKNGKAYSYLCDYVGKNTLNAATPYVCRKVLRGSYGKADVRTTNLLNLGYSPTSVQNKVNQIVEIANGIKDGKLDYGKNKARLQRIDAELGKGYGQLVQDYINVLCGVREKV